LFLSHWLLAQADLAHGSHRENPSSSSYRPLFMYVNVPDPTALLWLVKYSFLTQILSLSSLHFWFEDDDGWTRDMLVAAYRNVASLRESSGSDSLLDFRTRCSILHNVSWLTFFLSRRPDRHPREHCVG
jgi:hypothetical protein